MSTDLQVHLFISSGASICLLYSVSVLIFNASTHECSWTFMTGSILTRAAFLNACVSVSSALAQTKELSVILGTGVLLNTIAVFLIAKTRSKYVQGPKPTLKAGCMKDRVALITGANTGIGKETARQLLNLGATVVFACRSEERAKEAMEDIARVSNQDNMADFLPLRERMHFLQLDLSSILSVRMAVLQFKKMKLPLHVLINNAGILMGEHKKNQDGYELMMTCNHLGHFLLTNLLLPKLRQSPDARILTLTSSTYALATHMDLDDLFCEKGRKYTLFGQYAQTKLANILFTKELAKREQKYVDEVDKIDGETKNVDAITCCAVHPGLVKTDVIRNLPWFLRQGYAWFGFLISAMQKTVAAGAYTSVYCAASDEVKSSNGLYYVNSAHEKVTKAAMDQEASKKLWQVSEKLVGLQKKE